MIATDFHCRQCHALPGASCIGNYGRPCIPHASRTNEIRAMQRELARDIDKPLRTTGRVYKTNVEIRADRRARGVCIYGEGHSEPVQSGKCAECVATHAEYHAKRWAQRKENAA